MTVLDQFNLAGKFAVVTGGEGLLGKIICETIRDLGGVALSVDIDGNPDFICDITKSRNVRDLAMTIRQADILINNAVGNQKPVHDMTAGWVGDIAVGLTGAINMIGAFRDHLWESGVILNIGSDLALIGPDPALYEEGMMKPASYSAVKHGIIGITRYFAAAWPNIRCNCLCPGGIDQGQKVPYVPMKRLAKPEEMKGPVAFMISNASSYMTGAVVTVDGGRTCW